MSFSRIWFLTLIPALGFPFAARSADAPGAEVLTSVQSDFHGKLDAFKQGPLSKMGMDLAMLYREYEASGAQATTSDFQSIQSKLNLMSMPDGAMGVAIEAASLDGESLLKELQTAGLTHGERYGRMVSGILPIMAVPVAAAMSQLRFARPTQFVRRTGIAVTQGVDALRADVAQTRFSTDGSGVTVGTLSDSFNCLGTADEDVDSGDLPGGIIVLDDPNAEQCEMVGGTDEGRAMMQLIADVAPGASQAFHTALPGQPTFANGIVELRSEAGADVIVDDILYLAEPMFEDGIIAQAADAVTQDGGMFFSAAGNNGRDSFEDSFRNSGVEGEFGEASVRHQFNTQGDTRMRVRIPEGGEVTLILQWDEPFFSIGGAGSSSDIDLYIYGEDGETVVASALAPNTGGDAVEILNFTNEGTNEIFNIGLDLFLDPAGAPPREPRLMKIVYMGPMTIEEYDTRSSTAIGHANARGAISVGAAAYFNTPEFGVAPPRLQGFSSAGGVPVLFDAEGNRLAEPELRLKPEIVGPDAGDTSFFGSGDLDSTGFLNFFGTSASAPHLAGVAALMKSRFKEATRAEVLSAMEATAIEMNEPGFDFDSGFGFVNSVAALEALERERETASRIAIVPSSLSFAPLAPGAVSDREVRIENRGVESLIITSVAGTDTLAAPFSIVSDACTGKQLAREEFCLLMVRLAPDTIGEIADSFDIQSNDPRQRRSFLRVSGNALATPEPTVAFTIQDVVDFGPVKVGETEDISISLRNDGNQPFSVESVEIGGVAARDFSQRTDCRSIMPAQRCRLVVSFSPGAVDKREARLSVNFNNGVSERLRLMGTGVEQASPVADVLDTLDFGDVEVGERSSEIVIIRNMGNADLTVSKPRLLGPDRADFDMGSNCGVDLPAGAGCFFTLRFTPSAEGLRRARIHVDSNDPAGEGIEVALRGTGGSDADGVSDRTEDRSVAGGDGNADGIADRTQAEVATLEAINGKGFTVVVPEGARLENLLVAAAVADVIGVDRLPRRFQFPLGFLGFEVITDAVGPVPMEIILPENLAPTALFNLGTEPDNGIPHLFNLAAQRFGQGGEERVRIEANRVHLNIADGGLADRDGRINGRILLRVAPAIRQ